MFDINKVLVSGKLSQLENFKTKKEIAALNFQLVSKNRYVDIIACVAYGPLAELINKSFKLQDEVIISGRLMSLPSKDGKSISLRVVVEKIGREFYATGLTENGQTN